MPPKNVSTSVARSRRRPRLGMMATRFGEWLLGYRHGERVHKLTRVFFARDGSFYVMSPYHPAEKALIAKVTVNYARAGEQLKWGDAVELALLDDDERRLKLSHHPDGFTQFSGQGIVSGKDEQGSIRGIGVQWWPLAVPTRGPAFTIAIRGIEAHRPATGAEPDLIVFSQDNFVPLPDWTHLAIEGHYFPGIWRRFIRLVDGEPRISIVHPAKAVLDLRVLLPSNDCETAGVPRHRALY